MEEVKKVVKNFEELEFSDDFMFGKVMEDPQICQDVIECLLQQPIGELIKVQTQREFKYTSDGKSIRLDVYNENSAGSVFDAEMQNLNNKSIEFHQLPKRSRFYQGAIDTDYLDKGHSYKTLPDSKVMFICTFDPFKLGRAQYTFTETCEEAPELKLKDGTTKIFYNCCYVGDDLSKEVKELYDYIRNGRVTNSLTKRIEEAVEKGRKNKVLRSEYLKERQILMDEREEGREEGRALEIKEKITDMLRRGKTVEEIVDFCGYPYDQVKEIEESLLATARK